MPYYHLFRGIPGTGKTTAAKKLQNIFHQAGVRCNHFEADMFFMKDGEYQFDAGKLGLAHAWCQKSTIEALKRIEAVLVSNTFTMWKEIKPYVEVSFQLRNPLLITSMETEYGNVHGVPLEKLDQMRGRYQSQHLIASEIVFNFDEAIVNLDKEGHIEVSWKEK